VRNKLAVLIALAKRPEGRATLHEIRDEVALIIASTDETIGNDEQLSVLDHVDVFQSGLVAFEDDSLRITENGCSLLRTLGISAQELLDLDFASTLQTLNMIDDLNATEARRKIFDLEPRSIDSNTDLIPPDDETISLEALSGDFLSADPRVPAESNDCPMEADRPAAMSNDASVITASPYRGPRRPSLRCSGLATLLGHTEPSIGRIQGRITTGRQRSIRFAIRR
jgi:hypothetical protein